MALNDRWRAYRALAALAALVLVTGLGLVLPGVAHADEIRDKQWHLNFLHVAEAHKITRGQGVTVAVLDTGVDYRHPDLKGALIGGNTYAGGRDDGWEDATGHGTGMASLIAGRGHGANNGDGILGVAPAVKILPVRIASGRGDTRGLQQGLEWAADQGADVINVSQGAIADLDVEESINRALMSGAVIIASAGNAFDGDVQVMAPARYPGVIAVSGTNQDGNFTDASVSGPQVVLSAPATGIMSAEKARRYGSGTGTSNSAAIVAGVAALVMSRYPDLDAANVIQRLIATADDRGPDGRDSQYGFGLVDPVAALTEDVPTVRTNPLIAPSASPTEPAPSNEAVGIGSAGHGLVSIVILGVFALAVAGLTAASRRRRRAALARSVSVPQNHSAVRPPTPPNNEQPPR